MALISGARASHIAVSSRSTATRSASRARRAARLTITELRTRQRQRERERGGSLTAAAALSTRTHLPPPLPPRRRLYDCRGVRVESFESRLRARERRAAFPPHTTKQQSRRGARAAPHTSIDFLAVQYWRGSRRGALVARLVSSATNQLETIRSAAQRNATHVPPVLWPASASCTSASAALLSVLPLTV